MEVSSAFLEPNSGHCGFIEENTETVKVRIGLGLYLYENVKKP